MLKVFIGHPDGVGLGDLIQWSSAIVEWQLQNPGQRVKLAYSNFGNCDVIHHMPGVEYEVQDRCPNDYHDLYKLHLEPGRGRVRAIWEELGLNWKWKRLWYSPTERELAFGRRLWQGGDPEAPRVVVPWHRYGRWKNVDTFDTTKLVKILQGNHFDVLLFDQDSLAPDDLCVRHWKHERGLSYRWLYGAVASAHAVCGVSSHPFYAALGMGVPAVGVFTTTHPDDLFWPVHAPRCEVHWAGGPNRKPELITAEAIAESMMRVRNEVM